jgi:signal transduction histidine kinase
VRRPFSLRWRLVVGSLLWTAGLIVVVNYLSLSFIRWRRVGGPALHFSTMFVLGIGSLIIGLVQVQRGMSSFRRLRSAVTSVREGTAARVAGHYPAEVQPVVDDLNALLDHRERAVNRAIAKAGDLAHGLKTPLAVLAQEAARAKASGQIELAASIDEQVERMRRQVDYHLAHARAAAAGATPGARCQVLVSVEGLARTLLRLHTDRGLAIGVDIAPDHFVKAQREDLDEMLGNLIDNACKWARSRVVLMSALRDGDIAITVTDDGPGVDIQMRDQVLRRGVRGDEAAPGSGFGLAIVRELAEIYGGTIALGAAPGGGLQAELRLPHA